MTRKKPKVKKLRTRHMPNKIESNKRKLKNSSYWKEFLEVHGDYSLSDDDIPDEDKH